MLLDQIKKDYKDFRIRAKESGNKKQYELGKEVLSLILSNVKNKEITLKSEGKEITDLDVIKVIENEIKQIKDTISYLEKAGKENEAAEENVKIMIIEKYLPKKLTEEELKNFIINIIKENNIEEINKGKGIIFKILKEKYGGQYDGQLANKIINNLD